MSPFMMVGGFDYRIKHRPEPRSWHKSRARSSSNHKSGYRSEFWSGDLCTYTFSPRELSRFWSGRDFSFCPKSRSNMRSS